MKNTVHPLEGLVQGFFISDIGLKQTEEVQVQGSDPGQAPGGPAFINPTEHRQWRPLFLCSWVQGWPGCHMHYLTDSLMSPL